MLMGPWTGPVDAEGLARAYAWPDGTAWVRAMMLTTLDGAAAGPDGHSRSISAPPDRAVLAEVRRLADVVLIGAGTLRAERYAPIRVDPSVVDARRALGQADAPVLAVVSASLDLPWDDALFTGEAAVRPLVVTLPGADGDRLERARAHADVVLLAGDTVDPGALLDTLRARGLHRVVCEGGPRLLAGLTTAGLVDEADITLAPLIVGGGQIVTGHPTGAPTAFDLAHVVESDGYLFNRLVARPSV
jgi:riboflavin biosynthesis pyrimidine reductase